MKIGIVDYGIGNHASVRNVLSSLRYRSQVTNDANELKKCDVLILPGVGAFRPAMAALLAKGLDQIIFEHVRLEKPLIGICLGMELLATKSSENGDTNGLGILPGVIDKLPGDKWHIGWNTVTKVGNDTLCAAFDSQCFYFNHSFSYQSDTNHSIFDSNLKGDTVVAAVRIGQVVGFQFHPEKSQTAGRNLLAQTISGLSHA